ncbi:MAG: hypothetical protein HN413_08335 [Chloroflexi bacterium]|jgi:hypothetical protein|nr:hypothetical protein [Chloroflexota bacterium]MBT7991318.1 hypothetical protein [Anaerolineae bacterium]
MINPPIKPYPPLEEESAWEIERQTEAFLQKLMEVNRKFQEETKDANFKLDDDQR